jgi:16S rRNA (guanine527-N7)-methyltransferase
MIASSLESRLREYARLVRSWAPRLDLVAPGDLDRFEERHIEDSLRVLPLVNELPAGPICDVGSGAGLPGIPLALASGRHVRLIEPRARRAAFLEECVRALEIDGRVVVATAEEAAEDSSYASAHAAAFARALAPPATAARMILPLVRPGGAAVVFVGNAAEVPGDAVEWAPGIVIFGRSPELNE